MENKIIEEGKIVLKKKKEKKKDVIESLLIYGKYLDLISYTEMILKKYPKCERFALASSIKKTTYEGMECVIYGHKYYDKTRKLEPLN